MDMASILEYTGYFADYIIVMCTWPLNYPWRNGDNDVILLPLVNR